MFQVPGEVIKTIIFYFIIQSWVNVLVDYFLPSNKNTESDLFLYTNSIIFKIYSVETLSLN